MSDLLTIQFLRKRGHYDWRSGPGAFRSAHKLFKTPFVDRERLVFSTCVYRVTNDKKAISRAAETIGIANCNRNVTTFNGSLRRSCGNLSFFFSPIDPFLVDRGSLNYCIFQPLLKIIHRPSFPDPPIPLQWKTVNERSGAIDFATSKVKCHFRRSGRDAGNETRLPLRTRTGATPLP